MSFVEFDCTGSRAIERIAYSSHLLQLAVIFRETSGCYVYENVDVSVRDALVDGNIGLGELVSQVKQTSQFKRYSTFPRNTRRHVVPSAGAPDVSSQRQSQSNNNSKRQSQEPNGRSRRHELPFQGLDGGGESSDDDIDPDLLRNLSLEETRPDVHTSSSRDCTYEWLCALNDKGNKENIECLNQLIDQLDRNTNSCEPVKFKPDVPGEDMIAEALRQRFGSVISIAPMGGSRRNTPRVTTQSRYLRVMAIMTKADYFHSLARKYHNQKDYFRTRDNWVDVYNLLNLTSLDNDIACWFALDFEPSTVIRDDHNRTQLNALLRNFSILREDIELKKNGAVHRLEAEEEKLLQKIALMLGDRSEAMNRFGTEKWKNNPTPKNDFAQRLQAARDELRLIQTVKPVISGLCFL